MAFRDPFRFSMRPNDTEWYYWDSGILNTSTTAKYIYPPHEWQKTGSKWKRSLELRGLTRSIAAPYQFVLDGAAILRAVYLNGSIESKVYFLIERLNDETQEYEDYFSGEIDLSTFLDGVIYNDGRKAATAAVIEGGVSAILDANENTPYQIELDPGDPEIATINMDGITVRVTYVWGLLASTSTKNITADPGAGPAIPMNDRAVPLYSVPEAKEGEYQNGTQATSTDILMRLGAFALGSTEQNNEIYEATGAQDVTITFNPMRFVYSNANYSGGNSGPVHMRVSVMHWQAATSTATRTASFRDISSCAVGNTKPWVTPSVTFHRSLAVGDRLYIVYDVVTTSFVSPTVGSWGFDYDAAPDAVNLGVAFRLPSTDCNSFPYVTAVRKFLEQVTGITGVLESSFFDNVNLVTKDCRPFNVKLTSGDALRRLTHSPAGVEVVPFLTLTWAELKKDMRYRFGLGVNIRDNKVIIEEAGSFFNESEVIADLGEVRSMTYEPARDYFATSQKWGYSAQSDGKLNGRDEPNTTQVWKWPVIRVQKDEDCLCPFITGMYEIEEARANLDKKKSIDANSDHRTFCIETEGTTSGGKYDLYRPQLDYSQPAETGLLYPDTAYNLTMSPKRNLLRSGKFIRMALYNLEAQTLTFQTTERNAEMNINLGSGAIEEKAAIVIGTLDAPFAKPFLFHVDAMTPIAMKQSMDAIPNGCFAWTAEGIEYKGFPVEVGIDGEMRNSYQMTMLCSPSTDVTPLITYS